MRAQGMKATAGRQGCCPHPPTSVRALRAPHMIGKERDASARVARRGCGETEGGDMIAMTFGAAGDGDCVNPTTAQQ